jgi:hypothetical protein
MLQFARWQLVALDAASVPIARAIVAWLRRHENDLGKRIDADVDARPLVLAVGLANVVVIGGSIDAPQ